MKREHISHRISILRERKLTFTELYSPSRTFYSSTLTPSSKRGSAIPIFSQGGQLGETACSNTTRSHGTDAHELQRCTHTTAVSHTQQLPTAQQQHLNSSRSRARPSPASVRFIYEQNWQLLRIYLALQTEHRAKAELPLPSDLLCNLA